MRERNGTTFHLTSFEVALMIHLIAGNLDPKDFKHDEAKALIHKCKAQQASPATYLVVRD